jgi:VIT1/CCC1 family predicted Fe2+/Mn2+ transporter
LAATLPVLTQFALIEDKMSALRVSNAVAVVMLFRAGYHYGRLSAAPRPWAFGLLQVVLGGVLVGITMALGG